jgi:hypothetical protein
MSELKLYLLANYKTIIPHKIQIDALNEYLDEDYESLDEDKKKFKTSIDIIYSRGDRVFDVTFEIYLSYILKFNLINTANCRGDKCRRDRRKTIDYWCIACHTEPWEMDTPDIAEFLLKNNSEYLTFHHILPYINSCMITSLEEDLTTDARLERFTEITEDIKSREAYILSLSTQLDKLRNEFDSVLYGFKSKEELDDFISNPNKD